MCIRDSSEPAVSVSQPEPEPQPAVTTLRFSATGDNLIHDGLYLQARSRAGGEGYDFTALYEKMCIRDRRDTARSLSAA